MKLSVFTVGEVARICCVAPRTVAKWVDSGLLEGYRVPGSRHRRVTRESLVRFLEANGMSLRLLEEYESAVMSCSSDRPAVRTEESKKKPRNADKFPLPTVMLRSREVAKMLGISQCTLWKWAKDGIIPHVCVSRSGHKTILYPLDELKAWLANQSRAQANGEKSE